MVPDSPAIQKDFAVTIWSSEEGDEALLNVANSTKGKNSRCEYKQIQAELRYFA
jgi:hypothetical protein